MSWLDGLRHVARTVLRPRDYARDLDDEWRFHLELEAMHRRHAGAPPPEAELAARRRFGNLTHLRGLALVAACLAALALALAAGGLYGVMAYTVAQRRRDLAIRVALGASPGDVVRAALARGAGTVMTGVGVGLGLAVVGARLLRAVLVDVSPFDPLAFGGVLLVVTATALAAAAAPARRAVRVDPVGALRGE